MNDISRRGFLKGTAGLAGVAMLGGIIEACATPAPGSPSATSSAGASPGRGTPTPGSATLRFWHIWGGTRTELLEGVLKDFEAKNPGTTVEPRLLSFDQSITEQLTALAAKDVPELSQGYPVNVPQFIASGGLVSLSPYLERDKIVLADILNPSEVALATTNGSVYTLPMTANGTSNNMFYNRALFESAGLDPDSPPRTWDELKSAALKLTKRDGNRISQNGITILSSNPLVSDYKSWLIANGGEWLSADGKTATFVKGLETLEWIFDFAESVYGGWENIAATGTQQEEVTWTNFYSGLEAMYVAGPWYSFLVQSNAPDVFKSMGVALRPSNGTDKIGAAIGDGAGLWMLAGNKNPDAAWELMKYLTIGEGGYSFLKAQKRPSPVKVTRRPSRPTRWRRPTLPSATARAWPT